MTHTTTLTDELMQKLMLIITDASQYEHIMEAKQQSYKLANRVSRKMFLPWIKWHQFLVLWLQATHSDLVSQVQALRMWQGLNPFTARPEKNIIRSQCIPQVAFAGFIRQSGDYCWFPPPEISGEQGSERVNTRPGGNGLECQTPECQCGWMCSMPNRLRGRV